MRLVAAVLSLVLLGVCPVWSGELRFGNLQTPSGAVGIVASEVKIWDKYGVAVQTLPFVASINSRDALVGGKIDIGITAIPNFLSAAVEADAVTIGVAVDQCASTAVMVKPDAPYRSLADLKGKRIASQTATATYGMFVNRVLPQSGMKGADVQLVNIRFQDMVSALVSGSVDAVTVVDPFLSSAEQSKTARVVTDFCAFAPVPLLLTTTQAVLKRQGDDVAKFVRGWLEAVRFIQEQPARAAEIYGKALGSRGYELPPEVVTNLIRRLGVTPRTITLTSIIIESMKQEAQNMQKAGTLSRIPDWSRIVQPIGASN